MLKCGRNKLFADPPLPSADIDETAGFLVTFTASCVFPALLKKAIKFPQKMVYLLRLCLDERSIYTLRSPARSSLKSLP